MSKITWKKDLGGGLTLFKRERSKYFYCKFWVSKHYSKNGMFVQSLKPITAVREGTNHAKKIYRDFPFHKYNRNPLTTTFNDVAEKAYVIRKKNYKIKELGRGRGVKKTTADKEWDRYLKEIKPELGRIEVKNRESLENAIYDLVDRLKTNGTMDGKKIQDNTISKYLNIISYIQKRAIADELLTSTIANPPLSRRSNPRPAYRMLELKQITDEIMEEFKRTKDLFYLEMHDYVQFLIASPTRPGMETISLKMSNLRLLKNKDGVPVLKVFVDHTKTGDFTYPVSPEFLRLYSDRLMQRFESLEQDDYFWFPKDNKTRANLQGRIRKNFVRISDNLGLYKFNGKVRPMTSIRHASIQRMKKEGVDLYEVVKVHNTSLEMEQKHYGAETDDQSLIDLHDKIYAKRIK